MFMYKITRNDKSRHTNHLYICAVMACALSFAGCSQQQQKAINGPGSVPDINVAEAMEISEDVLAKMHFEIEKADVQSGYLKTRPLPGAQFFEFWRSDNVGSENALFANLHTIRRTVELNVIHREGQLDIDCDVSVQRLSLPERETGSNARAYGMYTRSGPTLQKLRFDPAQIEGISWIDLDEDKKLAAEIVKRITERIALLASDESQASESRT